MGGLKIFGPRGSPMETKLDGWDLGKKNPTEAKIAHLMQKLGHFFAIWSMKYSFLRYFWA